MSGMDAHFFSDEEYMAGINIQKCFCTACAQCTNSGLAPTWFDVVVDASGYTDPCLYCIPTGEYFKFDTAVDFSGTYRVTRNPGSPCQWIKEITSNLPIPSTLKKYSGVNCTGTTTTVNVTKFTVRLGSIGSVVTFDLAFEIETDDGTCTTFYPSTATHLNTDCCEAIEYDDGAGVTAVAVPGPPCCP